MRAGREPELSDIFFRAISNHAPRVCDAANINSV
jgi:hypothetical protein